MLHLGTIKRNAATFALTGVLILMGVFTLISPRVLPYNMDEFSGQHALGCAHFPLNDQLQHYDESCQKYELTPVLFSHPLRLRSYGYVGSILVAPYYPLWILISGPISIRIQGFIFFVVMIWLIARIARVHMVYVLLASLFFPLFFLNALADTGISNLPIVCFLGILLLIRELPSLDSRKRLYAAFGIGLLIFMGMWSKLTFGWFFLPLFIYFIFTLVETYRKKISSKIFILPLLTAVITCLIPSLWLFTAKNDQGLSYISSNGSQLDLSRHSITHVIHLITPYLLDGSLSVNRILSLTHHSYDILPVVLAILVGIWALLERKTRSIALVSLIGGGIMFGTMILFRATAHPHHIMLLMPFLALGIAQLLEILSKRQQLTFSLILLITAGYWVTIAFRLPYASVSSTSNRPKDILLAQIRESGIESKTVQVHSSWGTYYIANLFGDHDQAVTFAYDIENSPDRLRSIKSDAQSLHREVLIITSDRYAVTTSPNIQRILGTLHSEITVGDWSALEY